MYFDRLRDASGAVLLDAGRPTAERGRYDILSAWPRERLLADDGDAGAYLARLRAALRSLGPAEPPAGVELPFCGGLLGYLAYDFGAQLETQVASRHAPDDLPDAQLGLYDWALITDHQTQCSQLVFHPSVPAQVRAERVALFEAQPTARPEASFSLQGGFRRELSEDEYRRAIERIQAYIQAGDCYQVNFTQRFIADCQGDAWVAYRALRRACPTPFSGFLALDGGDALLSLSPERFVQVRGGTVETRPIKGTRPRDADVVRDRALADELLASPKDRAENLMIVDLLRNDLGRSCAPGSVRVPELFALESYPNVHHLVSTVTGRLAPGLDTLDLLAGAFPGGSITGAPKIRAMQIIDELEPCRRGFYCGSLLYLDVRGEMDSSIAIRSLRVRQGQVQCWGGGGIVADSQWQDEYRESLDKVRVLLQTLESL